MLHWAPVQQGLLSNRKRVYRLNYEEGLRLRRRRRKQVAAAWERLAAPTPPERALVDGFHVRPVPKTEARFDCSGRRLDAREPGDGSGSLASRSAIECRLRAGEEYG